MNVQKYIHKVNTKQFMWGEGKYNQLGRSEKASHRNKVILEMSLEGNSGYQRVEARRCTS